MRVIAAVFIVMFSFVSAYADAPLSSTSKACMGCHKSYTPGIVGDWQDSRHSTVTPATAMNVPGLKRRISAETLPAELSGVVVGCYECHGLNTADHKDAFDHFGFKINLVVSPKDCATCHPTEQAEFDVSKMSNARGNIENNPVYHMLYNTILSSKVVNGIEISEVAPSAYGKQDACFGCHGTELVVNGKKTVMTRLGEIEVPDVANWPNQGVGRINPDGSRGTCTACHTRHAFSIEVARKPFTCSQCHLLPDVPAYDVYEESKHGNIIMAQEDKVNWTNVPWVVGEDFKAPTCAACHMALLVKPDGSLLVNRSHDFGSRLWVRLFGLPYSVPQPISGNTNNIRNRDGQPLPSTFDGEPATSYLIDEKEQDRRKQVMEYVCKGCHATDWTERHFAKLDSTIRETNDMTLQAEKLLKTAWDEKLADPSNPFNEEIEIDWVTQWLFYANTMRYGSAMTGAPDFVAFKQGWWDLTRNLQKMRNEIRIYRLLKGKQ